MKITFWGVRGSIAAPGPQTVIFGGNTTCLEVVLSSGKTVVIDAGTGIRQLGDALLRNENHRDVYLLLTHIHWDHLIGFPFFAPLFQNDVHIKLDGFKKGLDGLKRILSSSYIDGTWPICFEDLKARIEPTHVLPRQTLVLDDTRIDAHNIQHPQGGLGFRFVEDSNVFVFLTDNELMEHGWLGTSFKDFVKFCHGADVLVHDCQYTPEEMDKRKGWGHSDFRFVANLAIEAGVKRLILFHHDPWRTDDALVKLVGNCRDLVSSKCPDITVEAAREGAVLTL